MRRSDAAVLHLSSPFPLLRAWCLLLCLWLGWPAAAQRLVDDAAAPTPAFSLQVDAPEDLRDLLLQHLELQRYRELNDLDANELQRLLTAADVQARELLATRGLFAPLLDWQTAAGADTGPRWQVRLQVHPGPVAHIQEVRWHFLGHIQNSDAHAAQREALQQQWLLPAGKAFSQDAWNEAKAASLRLLTAEHYPLGRWVHTQAHVDAQQHSVVLELTADSGPEVFFGPTTISGQERYSVEQARRLANLPTGRSYRQSDLLEAQQRLVLSGYYDAVFVSLDTEGSPEAMPVRIELKEALRQRWQLGVGVRSDTGPRLTLEHTQHRVPGLHWRAVTRLSVDRVLQSASVDLLSPPDSTLWRWGISAKAEHQKFDGYEVNSQRLRAGRTRIGENIDRSWYAQYDNAQTTGSLADTRNAASAHHVWTWRHFDSLPFPTRGWGLGIELGAGVTLGEPRMPYTRGLAKTLVLLPVGEQGYRLSLRGEAGAVATHNADSIPVTQMFVAGGEHSVRGYAPGSIGIVGPTGLTTAGRYLLTGSAEWLMPVRLHGRRTEWDSVLFVDSGAVTNTPGQWRPATGVGLGARWRSPVGPLEIDLARALQTQRWRLHISIGFRF